jgi:hypothetical protein
MLMIILLLRRSKRLGIGVIFLFHFLCGGEWREEGAGQWHEVTRVVENSHISSLVLVFLDGSCLNSGILVFKLCCLV